MRKVDASSVPLSLVRRRFKVSLEEVQEAVTKAEAAEKFETRGDLYRAVACRLGVAAYHVTSKIGRLEIKTPRGRLGPYSAFERANQREGRRGRYEQ